MADLAEALAVVSMRRLLAQLKMAWLVVRLARMSQRLAVEELAETKPQLADQAEKVKLALTEICPMLATAEAEEHPRTRLRVAWAVLAELRAVAEAVAERGHRQAELRAKAETEKPGSGHTFNA